MIPDWDRYFLDIAETVSERGSCPRLKVGAILVSDRHILATGYNGSIAGMPSCLDAGCLMEGSHCKRTVHAEINALAYAARNGITTDVTTCYCNYGPPCWECFRVLANAGITEYVWTTGYKPDPRVLETVQRLGLQLVHYPLPTETYDTPADFVASDLAYDARREGR